MPVNDASVGGRVRPMRAAITAASIRIGRRIGATAATDRSQRHRCRESVESACGNAPICEKGQRFWPQTRMLTAEHAGKETQRTV
ncbi:hypothetical protein [Sorangium sp. So ce861]|uniref:hypothetical protein n=1 Tax=Sorangium sp. So ce861 TaxID=3133323 RepID=UPI003F644F57